MSDFSLAPAAPAVFYVCGSSKAAKTERETKSERDRKRDGKKQRRKPRKATTFGWSELLQCAVGSLAQLSEL